MYQFIYLFMSKSLYSELEHNTRAFLDNLRQNPGPPIYTLSPHDARAVLSGLQSSIPVKKPPADIENRTIPSGIGGKDISITIVRPPNSSNETSSINGENDVLCDEGEAYARKLLEAGVRVTAVRYHGTIHDFVMINAITDDPAPRGSIEQASHTLKKVLSA
jgi:alpha/beta hydrolase family protein